MRCRALQSFTVKNIDKLMQIDNNAIEEFKEIYLEEYNEQLPDKIAMEKAMQFINQFKIIYRPITDLTYKEKSNLI